MLMMMIHEQKDEWIAGSTIAVQVGDVLDRGWQELQVGADAFWCYCCHHVTRAVQTLLYIEMIEREAARKGGALYSLLGNHEIMTVCMAVISSL